MSAQDWNGRRILVTGAAGFIGSHLCEHLVRRGAVVRAFVRYNSRNDYGWLERLEAAVAEEIEVFRGDLVNPEAVARAADGQDAVAHLGALIPIPYSYVHPREYVSVNVEGTLNVLEAVRRLEIPRLVHTSTSEVYGTAERVPIDEDHPLRAQSPYAATKVAADQLALSYHRSFSTPVVVARPFNTYGPRQSARAVIPSVVSQALERELVEVGSLSPTRDFVFVDDTVQGLEACLAAPAAVDGEVVNLGTGVETAIEDVVLRVLALVGQDLPVAASRERERPPRSEVERLVADASKARRLLGWAAKIGLDEGLPLTVEWVRGAPETFKTSVYNT